ncbi:MAG: hypothetical protein IN808_00165 [Rubrobacter sp.]|nr:hypothetical protein [Rubrobacter sp.]
MSAPIYAETAYPESGSGPPGLLEVYLARIGREELLGKDAELELARLSRAGDERARRKLIEKNLRLVVSIAKRYRGMGLPFEDGCVRKGYCWFIRRRATISSPEPEPPIGSAELRR